MDFNELHKHGLPPMPISDHDQHYAWETCSWETDAPNHLDPSIWLCTTCWRAIHILMRDEHCRGHLVQRMPAQQFKVGDELYNDGWSGLAPAQVHSSAKATGKGKAGQWSLLLSGEHGRLNVLSSRYFNRIVPA